MAPCSYVMLSRNLLRREMLHRKKDTLPALNKERRKELNILPMQATPTSESIKKLQAAIQTGLSVIPFVLPSDRTSVIISFPLYILEQIDIFTPNSIFAFILTRSGLGFLLVLLLIFVPDLWPFIYAKISFPLNILRTNQ